MTHEPLWLDEARVEVVEAARWYAEQAPEVLLRFFDAVDHAQTVVAATPRAWQAGVHGTRRYVLRRFPFLLVYRIRPGGVVEVVAFAHERRKPGYWKGR